MVMAGSSLARPGFVKPPPAQTSELDKALKLIAEIAAAQAKIDEKFERIRFPFLLTNPNRKSVREKATGLVRIHQCVFSKIVGKLSRCSCEFITEGDAAMLTKQGQAGWITDAREQIDEHTWVDSLVEEVVGTSPKANAQGMQLFVSAEEWESLVKMREYDRAEKSRTAHDGKWAKQRQETFEKDCGTCQEIPALA